MPAWDLPSFQLLQKALFLMVSCCELQIFLSDRWTRLLYGRVAMQTRSFTASSVYSRKSRRSCDSGLVARHRDVQTFPGRAPPGLRAFPSPRMEQENSSSRSESRICG